MGYWFSASCLFLMLSMTCQISETTAIEAVVTAAQQFGCGNHSDTQVSRAA